MIGTARAQLMKYPSVRFIAGQVVDVTPAEHRTFEVTLETGGVERARRLVLAMQLRFSPSVYEGPAATGVIDNWPVRCVCPRDGVQAEARFINRSSLRADEAGTAPQNAFR